MQVFSEMDNKPSAPNSSDSSETEKINQNNIVVKHTHHPLLVVK